MTDDVKRAPQSHVPAVAAVAHAPGPTHPEPSPGTIPPAPAEQGSAAPRSWRRTTLFVLLIAAGILIALYAWDYPPFHSALRKTDNAYVRGQTTIISPQVGGYVTEVSAKDFECVVKGQRLATIDDRIYRQRVAQGLANVDAQSATLDNSAQSRRTAEAQVRLQDATVFNAVAQLARARADMRRVDDLAAQGSVSLRERDQTRASLKQAEAGVRQAEAQRAIAVEQVRSVGVGRSGLQAGVANARAGTQLAQIDLSNTIIRAPADGCLSEIGVRVGQLVAPGAQLMFLVPQTFWVVANFKEAQAADIAVDQRAWIEVDGLGGRTLTGRVERRAPAASSEFSVIRPDTGAGNFVKVAQRLAVRIRIDPNQALARRLAPGMSVEATVDTADQPR